MGVAWIISSVTEYVKSIAPTSLKAEKERDFMHDLSDIRFELDAIDEVLAQQKSIITAFRDSMGKSNKNTRESASEDVKVIDAYRARIKKIQKDADRIDQAVSRDLDLKRTWASMQDARSGLLLNYAVVGFTIITIMYAPLGFVASLLALPIDSLTLHNGKYKSGYVAGIFGKAEGATIAATIVVIVTALISARVWNALRKPSKSEFEKPWNRWKQRNAIQKDVVDGDNEANAGNEASADKGKQTEITMKEAQSHDGHRAEERPKASDADISTVAKSSGSFGIRKLLGGPRSRSRDPEK